jgi:hypothetical protein
MGKWIYVDGRAKHFESGEELVQFLKDRISKLKQNGKASD